MKYKVLVGFSGKVSASKGSEIEIADKAIEKDLLKAGYIEEIKAEAKSKAKKAPAEAETPAEAEAPAEDKK